MSKFAIFAIEQEEFGIELNRVVEIVKMQKSMPLPQLPSFISGMINIRGDVIPLIDLRKRLGVAGSPPLEGRIIIAKIHGEKIGLLVDAVKEIVTIEDKSIVGTPSFFKGLKSEYLMGIGKLPDRLIIMLNLDSVLTSEEVILLGEHKEILRAPESPESSSRTQKEKKKSD